MLNNNLYYNSSANSDPVKALDFFLKAIKFKSLYILGAGASYRYIYPNYKIYDDLDKVLGYSIYDLPLRLTKLEEQDLSRYKVLGSPHTILEDKAGNLYFENLNATVSDYLKHSYPILLEMAAALSYTLPHDVKKCPEYQILNLTNTKSLFVSLNHDGLINTFLHQRKANIINLHGYLSKIEREILTSNLLDIIFYEIRPSFLDKLWLATKENDSEIVKKNEYKKFIDKLDNNLYNNILIIGYSFFFQFNQIQDITTYERLLRYIQQHHSQVYVIDTEPEKIVEILLQSTNKIDVQCYKVNWDIFTRAFFSTFQNRTTSWFRITPADIKYFLNCYYYYMDEGCNVEPKIYIPAMCSKSYSK